MGTAALGFAKSLLGSKWFWIAIGVAAAIFLALAYVDHKYNQGVKAGSAQVTTAVQQHTQKVQKAITDAQSQGPHTQSEVLKRLDEGTF
jgi:hypothetical protein